ncbi:hypothetical protein CUMW_000940 [Citrus unshiu]|nr:hypothetical protein CUMW_000940 [Citrus unshiu]
MVKASSSMETSGGDNKEFSGTQETEENVNIEEHMPSNVSLDGHKANGQNVLPVSMSQRGLLSDENPRLGKLPLNIPSRLNFLKFGSSGNLTSASAKFQQNTEERDVVSHSIPSSSGQGIQGWFSGSLAKKVAWSSLWKICKEWIKDPLNMALLLWIICVAVSGAILFLVMTGMLNHALPKKSQRDAWFEYTLCGLNWGYKRSERPAIGVGICLSVAVAAPAIAGLYSVISPLGKDYNSEVELKTQDQIPMNGTGYSSNQRLSLEKQFSIEASNKHKSVEYAPVWRGGLFDIWEDIAISYLSLFFSFCVFGWNMERLGFGNMYVHIATFFLFCTAPFWVFNFAAVNIDNETVREVLKLTGLVLCIFGLLYGGFWRIQMRKRFNLPANNSCCGKPAIADFAQWLFCCWCSLAQEVRTADYYDVVEGKLCMKQTDENSQLTLSPLPREDGSAQFRLSQTSLSGNNPGFSRIGIGKFSGPSRFSKDKYSPNRQASEVEGERDADYLMKPPVRPSIQR